MSEEINEGWNFDMKTAPKNRPIIVFCDHSRSITTEEGRLSPYEAWCDGLGYRKEPHQCIAVYGGGFYDGENDGGAAMPDWWFDANSEMEIPVYPIAWREGFPNPKVEEVKDCPFMREYPYPIKVDPLFDGTTKIPPRGQSVSLDPFPWQTLLTRLADYISQYKLTDIIITVGSGNSYELVLQAFEDSTIVRNNDPLSAKLQPDSSGKIGSVLGVPMYTDKFFKSHCLTDAIRIRSKKPIF